MSCRVTNAVAVSLSAAAFLFLFSGHLRLEKLAMPKLRMLTPEQGSEFLLTHEGFANDAVYTAVAPPSIGVELKRFGSWLQTDATKGRAESAWFPFTPEVALQVAGYPNSHGCQVYLEAEDANGVRRRVALPGDDPKESWQIRTVRLSKQSTRRFRIIAIDGSSDVAGWVGFSQPFRFLLNTGEVAKQVAMFLMVELTAAAALVALLFPGLWLRRRTSIAFLWIPLPGFLGLALLGLLCWQGPHALGVRLTAQLFLAPLFAYALYHSIRFPVSEYLSKVEQRILLVVLLLVALGSAKASYSVGPPGELYGGEISRTLEVGDRSDSRIPYHVIQLIAGRSPSHGALSSTLFGAWDFSARTPLVALAVSPIVLALPVHPPALPPDQVWTVFDTEGFSAFRTAMIVIACCSLTAAFGVAGLFVGEYWAFLAFLVTATAPFVIHETYFTWPKLAAAWFLLLATYLIVRGRCLMAGFLWGVGYLCHPLVLLFAPGLLGVVLLRGKQRSVIRNVTYLLPGVAACCGLWFLSNQDHFNQGHFLGYAAMADGVTSHSLPVWFVSRWNSMANTLLPLNLFLFHRDHPIVNSIFGPSPALVRFYFQYWNTLPFGVGITYFGFLVWLLYTGFLRARGWFLLVFALPFVCFLIYWGSNSVGLLREGLHPWVLGLLIFSIVMWRKIASEQMAFSAWCSAALALRSFETLAMLLLPSIFGSQRLLNTQFIVSDILSLIVMVVCTGCLAAITLWHLRLMQKESLDARSKQTPFSKPVSD